MKEYDTPIASVDAVILTLKNEKLHVLLVEREKEPYSKKQVFNHLILNNYILLVLLSVILVVGLLVLLMYL